MYLDTHGEDVSDLFVDFLTGETVSGDAVAEHAAQLLVTLVNSDLVAHEGQIVSSGQTAGATADDRHLLAGGFSAGRIGHVAGVVDGVLLQAADVHGIIHHGAAAAGLTGMLADVGTGDGPGIVLADQLDSILDTACGDEGDVAGNIHAGGTQRHTGNGVLERTQAMLVLNMGDVIILEAFQTVQHQTGGIGADGAVGGIHDGFGSVADDIQGIHGGLAVQHLTHQGGKLTQTDAAGGALTAGLGMAQVQEIQGHVHGAQARGAGSDPAFHVAVQIIHHRLSLAGGANQQSAHNSVNSIHIRYPIDRVGFNLS